MLEFGPAPEGHRQTSADDKGECLKWFEIFQIHNSDFSFTEIQDERSQKFFQADFEDKIPCFVDEE